MLAYWKPKVTKRIDIESPKWSVPVLSLDIPPFWGERLGNPQIARGWHARWYAQAQRSVRGGAGNRSQFDSFQLGVDLDLAYTIFLFFAQQMTKMTDTRLKVSARSECRPPSLAPPYRNLESDWNQQAMSEGDLGDDPMDSILSQGSSSYSRIPTWQICERPKGWTLTGKVFLFLLMTLPVLRSADAA